MLCSNALGVIKASCKMPKCEAVLLMLFNYLMCHLSLPSTELYESSKPRLTWLILQPLTVSSWGDSCLLLTLYFNWYVIINNWQCNVLTSRNILDG